LIQPIQMASERAKARITAQLSRDRAGDGLVGLVMRLGSAAICDFSHVAFASRFCGVKTKSPLDDGAVSGLEIRFKRLLKDSDRTPAPAVEVTTTRRTEAGLGAAIHYRKSYLEWMYSQRERFIEVRGRI
jgi:hypothetical protein